MASTRSFSGRLVVLEVGREAALVAHAGGEPALLEHAGQRVEHLGRPAQRLAERRRAERHDHELLQVHVVVRVLAAVHHVHERHRQGARVHAAEVAVERCLERRRRGLGHGDGDAEDGVRAELALGGRAVQLDHGLVHGQLVVGLHADDGGGDLLVHVAHGLLHALAAEAGLVAVAQLEGLVLAGRGAGGDGRPADGAAGELAVHLEGGVAAGVQDLSGLQGRDGQHGASQGGEDGPGQRCPARLRSAPPAVKRPAGQLEVPQVLDHRRTGRLMSAPMKPSPPAARRRS